ncbi:unnamed protein product [Adineta ricciae]|uniref:F-box domain-containing protein n=1 Tax=Adineta ricciae TaxID=249248 RepID=A0A815R7C0_ADIRI|nr:unnamed protein product [Adineta ricciae]CAF1473149.1 unnamed protein product [Adineta ricciae]
MIGKLEDLPNEILANIMEYISSPNDIYQAFNNLNQRFQTILQHLYLNIDISHEDKQILLSNRLFASYCNRLRLFNICPSISLHKFSRLRSLTMKEPTESQVNSIRSSVLPLLEHLTAPPTMMIFDCLFGNEKQRWKRLHSCSFLRSPLPNWKNTWKANSTLRKLMDICCSREILTQLLTLTPCLQYLHVEIPVIDDSTWKYPLHIDHLTSLQFEFVSLNYNDVSALLRGNLRRLHLRIYRKDYPTDFPYLGALIASNAPELKQFECDYEEEDQVDINEIRNAHRIFKNCVLFRTEFDKSCKLICKNIQCD